MSTFRRRAVRSREEPAALDLSVEARDALTKEEQSSSIKTLTTGRFSLLALLKGVTFFALFCGLILNSPAFISQILIGAIWIASAGWFITGICFARGDQRAFCLGAGIVLASMWTGVGGRFVEGMTRLLTGLLAILPGSWTFSEQLMLWVKLVLLLLATVANGWLAVRARHYYERATES